MLVTLLALLAAAVSLPFLAHGWLPLDDGIYSWYARQMADGAVPRRDLFLGAPGYVAYLNRWLYAQVGPDLLVLRYPLPLLTALIALFGIGLLHVRDVPSAISVAVISVGFGFPQFGLPSPGWYCLTLAFAFAWLLEPVMRTAQMANNALLRRLFIAGLVAGLCVGVRQLSGSFLVIAGLCVLALAKHRNPHNTPWNKQAQWIGVSALVGSGSVLLLYLYLTHSLSALYWAAPALVVLALAVRSVLHRWPAFAPTTLLWFVGGCTIGFLPLIVVSIADGVLWQFLHEITVGSVGYAAYGHSRNESFYLMMIDAIELLSVRVTLLSANSGLFLLLLLATPIGLLVCIWRQATRIDSEHHGFDPVLICACFFSLTAIFFQSYLYLFYSLPLTTLAMIRSLAREHPQRQRLSAVVAAVVALFALAAFGGRVPGEVLDNVYRGTTATQVQCGLPSCSLWVSPAVRAKFESALEDLRQVPSERPLLILPAGALYYMMLPNPTPWRWAALNPAALTDAEQEKLRQQLASLPGAIVAISREPGDSTQIPSNLRMALCPVALPAADNFTFHAACDERKVRREAENN